MKPWFVSPEYIGLEEYEESDCNHNISSYSSIFLAPIDHFINRWVLAPHEASVQIGDFLDDEILEDFRQAAQAKCEKEWELGEEERLIALPECGEDLVPDYFKNWTLRRIDRQWQIIGRIQEWRDEYLEYSTPISVSSDLSAKRLDLTSQIPPTTDVLLGPNERVGVLVSAEEIRMIRIVDGRIELSSVTLSKGRDDVLIMAEWAVGSQVTAWMEMLREHYGQGRNQANVGH